MAPSYLSQDSPLDRMLGSPSWQASEPMAPHDLCSLLRILDSSPGEGSFGAEKVFVRAYRRQSGLLSRQGR